MPTIDYPYVDRLRNHLTELWSPAHAQWKEWHDFHDQRHKIRYAHPADVRKLGIARAKLSAMVDTLVTNDPVVTRDDVAEGAVHEANTDKVEHWGKALLIHAATSGHVIPPFRTASTYLGLLGYSAGVVRWDDKLWDNKGKVARGPGYRKRQEEAARQQAKAFPYVIEFPHPARILLPHQERRPSVGIEIASMYGWQVKEMLGKEVPERVNDVHGDPYAILEVLNYWDEQKRGLFIDQAEVEVRDNALGMTPFVHGYSGYGHEHMPNVGSPGVGVGNMGPRPEDLAIGLLAGVTGSIVALDEATTALTYLVERAAYVTYFTKEDAEELARKLEQAGLGGIVQVGDPATALKPSDIPQLGAWVFEHIASLRRDIDEGTFMGIVAGEMASNVRQTATGTAIQLGQARLRFGEPMNQLNLMAGEMLGLCAKMTALRGEKVTIDGFSCGADEFEGNYDFKVDFMAKDEGQRLRDTAAANEGYKVGTESFEGVQAAKGVTDVTGKRREITIDKARAMPVYMETVMAAAQQVFQQRLAEKQAREAQKNGGGPMIGPDGMPVAEQPQGFTSVPGGPQQMEGVQQGLEQVPGEGMGRVVPNG